MENAEPFFETMAFLYLGERRPDYHSDCKSISIMKNRCTKLQFTDLIVSLIDKALQ